MDNQPSAVNGEKRGNPARRWIGCAGLLLGLMGTLLLTAGYFFIFRTVPLRISKETTYITEPLKSDGERVDYFTAWEKQTYPTNIATDENGYRLIAEHLGAAPEATPAHFARLCEKLGLDIGAIQPDMKLTDPHDFLAAYVAGEDFDEAVVEKLAKKNTSEDEAANDEEHAAPINAEQVLTHWLDRPWTFDDLPMMERWLAENGPAIDLIGEAVRKPTFCIPFARANEDEQLIELAMSEVGQARSFARALSTRANYRIATGEIDGAVEDIVTCTRLGRYLGQENHVIAGLIGVAIEGIADMIGIAGSLEHPPTKAQLERLANQGNNLPPKSEFDAAMLFERFQALDCVQTMATGKGNLDGWDMPTTMAGSVAFDWNVVTRRLNGHFDSMEAGCWAPIPRPNPIAMISARARSEMMADIFAGLLLPALDVPPEASHRIACVENLHQITLAMLRYERDHDTLPPAYLTDANAHPFHSWRVLLLPYLGQRELYDKIRLDEPWDSDHNRQFHKHAVPFYQCPSEELTPGQTTYSVVVGPDMPFEAGAGKTLAEFGPESRCMILVVEQKQAACWMDPTRDLPQAEAERGVKPVDLERLEKSDVGIFSRHPGGANVGLRDGSARFLSDMIESESLEGLLCGTADDIP